MVDNNGVKHVDIQIVPALLEHCVPIAARMRAADVDEVFAGSGRDPLDALEFSFRKSALVRTALVDGVPEVMFGAADLNILAGVAAPWLLGTDAVTKNYVAFLRGSVEWRSQLLTRYEVLRNLVDDRNAASKRWLRWLGFELSDPFPIGHEGRPFRLFQLRRDNV